MPHADHAFREADKPWPPSGPILILSPHLDDAALSCAAVLALDRPVEVVNVFAGAPDPPVRTRWTEITGFVDSAAATAARRAEDAAAFRGSGHRVRYLDLSENGYFEGPRSDSDANVVGDVIREWISRRGSGAVFAPAGAGKRTSRGILRRRKGIRVHPDHEFVRDAAFSALKPIREATLYLYDELPYALEESAATWIASFTLRGRTGREVAVEVDREEKAARIAAYESQLPHLLPDGVRLDEPNVVPRMERYWFFSS